MNNAVFGKTLENVRKRVDVRLVTEEKRLLKLSSQPTYVSHKIFNKNLDAVHKIKKVLMLNRPAYVGMRILDVSKTLMYDFDYNFVKRNTNRKLIYCSQILTVDETDGKRHFKVFGKTKASLKQ